MLKTAESVGWDNYRRVVDGIMEMINRTGLAHGYSFNSWSDVVQYDDDFIESWLDSPQTFAVLQLASHAEHTSKR